VRTALALLALAAPAAADPLDELGFGGAAAGLAGSNAATATGAAATHGSPAGAALADRPELLVGRHHAHDRLQLDGADADVLDARGTSLGLALPVVRGPDIRLAAALALYLPDQFLARIQLAPITEPRYVRFESAAHRAVVEPVLAIAFGRWAFGAGTTLLADARSRRLDLDVGVVSGAKQGAARVDVELPVRVAPLLGARCQLTDRLALAATVRGELSLDIDLDILATVDVPNVVTGDARIALRSVSYFTPLRAALAAAWQLRPDLALTADVAWERWSALGSGVPSLRVVLALDIQPPLVDPMQPAADFHDTVTPRLGAEWRASPRWRWRAGVAYLPSPVPAQTGLTSFADGARTLASAGAGWRIEPGAILAAPIDLDLGVAWQHVLHELVVKDAALQPGGAFSSGGDLLQASASATVRF
jgi:long-chain fatty acid transport protein